MQNDITWLMYYLKNYFIRYYKHKKNQINEKLGIDLKSHLKKDWRMVDEIAGKKQLKIHETNRLIANGITGENPFWAGRYGGMEMGMITSVLEERYLGKSDEKKFCFDGLCNNAGFFPKKIELADKFVDLMLGCCGQVDLLGTWNGLFMEDYIIKRYMPDSDLTRMAFLEPWYTYLGDRQEIKPWTNALKGRKVLVIHPFADTIQQQYNKNRKKIFKNMYYEDDILPEFDLKILKAVQTQAGTIDDRFNDWFEALQWMISEIFSMDFDVAILGCGAYGFPLAAEIKKMGKVAIHLGGATQLMFGIRGKRWDNNTRMQALYNEYWVRPSIGEKIEHPERIEEACYW